ncbi:hypothetical protein VTN00DRAFT_1548 [Thermoascus crustaceus]|uniref:uncharacterized protein n=1 Tax=Thermoascus crustaceus TaxID=5088 RepID=UPI003743161F
MPPKSKKKEPAAKPTKSSGSQPPAKKEAAQPPPNWPPLRPLVPASDLILDSLLEDQIYIIRNFFTSTLCRNYVSFLSSLPLVTTPGKPKKGEAVRVNDRFQIDDAKFAEMLWGSTALKELVEGSLLESDGSKAEMRKMWGGEPLGLNPNIRIYRYTPGQFFAQHYDDSNALFFTPPSPKSNQHEPETQKPISARTTWTLLIYLTTCDGGETVFYPDPTATDRSPQPISVAPEVGMALLHRHGERCLLHEGKEVRSGEKWVVRSDLVVGR